MPRRNLQVLITCEHAGNRVPTRYAACFRGAERTLASHRGWDPGALDLARTLARVLGAPLMACTTTRLLVDANRSEDNPEVLSTWTATLDGPERAMLLCRLHRPHWEGVATTLASLARRGPVAQVGVHTFTPVLRGVRRTADVGLLFDPSRPIEAGLCRAWRAAIHEIDPALRVRFNDPYRGTADGLTTAMRSRFAPRAYAGIELEVNQRFPRRGGPVWLRLQLTLARGLAMALTPPRALGPRPRTGTAARRGRSRPH